VFIDAAWAHLSMFAVGQAFSWRYARSGRFWLGAAATALLWVALDAWLVLRYLLGAGADAQAGPLVLLYAVVLSTAVSFLWASVRRLRGRPTRTARHREAISAMLRGDGESAIAAYRALVWCDGWDASAWIGLGDAERRYGQQRRAARSYGRARSVDVAARFRDVIEHRERLLNLAQNRRGAVVGRVDRPSEPGKSARSKADTAS
jgi:hypothetical protein